MGILIGRKNKPETIDMSIHSLEDFMDYYNRAQAGEDVSCTQPAIELCAIFAKRILELEKRIGEKSS